MEIINMIDAIGTEIVKGDFILYTNNNYLNAALVTRVTQGQIWYSYSSEVHGEKLISPDHVIIINDGHVARLANEYSKEPTSRSKIIHIRSAAAELIEIKQKMIDDGKL